MSRNAKITTALIALAFATVALTGCTATAAPESAEESPAASPAAAAAASEPTPAATPTPESTEPETCLSLSSVTGTDDLFLERKKPLKDLGVREFAQGEVTLDEDGVPVTYTVEPGDVEAVIAERLCAYPVLASMNHEHYVYPGLVLWLNPDPETPSLDFYAPRDAEAGFKQIPYQEAITAAGVAADAGDIDTVRAIWNDTPLGMFTDQEAIDTIQQVVDSGDPDALRQLFS
ncbi:hypothetical protein [Microbacterium marinilacus]|uniref:DUF3105 domain-containing protein n=1 Tax=Microbacterium marinilacus TaxID=415209 RepID=A0ABP7B878_9MICO|nr:hypothetical protein [Microbacterium marinilacus]MBY0687451.1 hypothetical protein [Microbacterium marinilacus]